MQFLRSFRPHLQLVSETTSHLPVGLTLPQSDLIDYCCRSKVFWDTRIHQKTIPQYCADLEEGLQHAQQAMEIIAQVNKFHQNFSSSSFSRSSELVVHSMELLQILNQHDLSAKKHIAELSSRIQSLQEELKQERFQARLGSKHPFSTYQSIQNHVDRMRFGTVDKFSHLSQEEKQPMISADELSQLSLLPPPSPKLLCPPSPSETLPVLKSPVRSPSLSRSSSSSSFLINPSTFNVHKSPSKKSNNSITSDQLLNTNNNPSAIYRDDSVKNLKRETENLLNQISGAKKTIHIKKSKSIPPASPNHPDDASFRLPRSSPRSLLSSPSVPSLSSSHSPSPPINSTVLSYPSSSMTSRSASMQRSLSQTSLFES